MCGRYALNAPPAELINQFGLDRCAEFSARYNISPGTDIPVIRHSPDGRRVLHLLRWGLVPHWAKDPSVGAKLNNARAESVAAKPSFRDAYRRRRCLIPADGFYEWKRSGRVKQPFFISPKSGEPLAMAGLWESWRAADGSILRSCAVITTTGNALMLPIHDRMPVLVAPKFWQAWLAGPAEEITDLLRPAPPDPLQAWPVDSRVGRCEFDDAGLIRPQAD